MGWSEQDEEDEQAILKRISYATEELEQQLQAAKVQIARKDAALAKLIDVCVTQIGPDYNAKIHEAYLQGKAALDYVAKN